MSAVLSGKSSRSVAAASRGGPLCVKDGWLETARRCRSPNCDARPAGTPLSLLVIHAISLPPGHFAGDAVERLFTNRLDHAAHPYYEGLRGLQVSAHLFLRRRGELIQFVRLDDRAWHAGVSVFEGRERCNDFSIGIELEGSDQRPFTAVQYRRLASVCRALMRAHPQITPARIVGHADIAPGRKTDPGPCFDWARFRAGLQETAAWC